jgi:hypothetical protein
VSKPRSERCAKHARRANAGGGGVTNKHVFSNSTITPRANRHRTVMYEVQGPMRSQIDRMPKRDLSDLAETYILHRDSPMYILHSDFLMFLHTFESMDFLMFMLYNVLRTIPWTTFVLF